MVLQEQVFAILLTRKPAAGWLVGALTLTAGITIRLLLDGNFSGFPFVTFFPAVLITAFFGGWQPASVTAAIALVFSCYYIIPPTGTFYLTANGVIGLLGGSFVMATEIVLTELTRTAARQLHERELFAKRLLIERDFMFGELQHRLANNMQFVAALLNRQARRLPPGALGAEVLRDSANRLIRFAVMHRKLQDPQGAQRGLAAVVTEVLTELLQTTSSRDVVLSVRVEEVPLPPNTIVKLALIASEAATNSVKHAFGKGRGTRLDIDLRSHADGAEFTVADDGPGFPAVELAAGPAGLGMGIMQSLARQLGGKAYSENNQGATVRIVFPLANNDDVPVAGGPMAGGPARCALR